MQSWHVTACTILLFLGAHWVLCLLLAQLALHRRQRGSLGRRVVLTSALVVAGSLGTRAEEIERQALQISSRSLPLRDLPPELEGLRVVLISDLHKGPFCPPQYLERVVDEVNSLAPDLVLIPGDFVHRGHNEFAQVALILRRLQPRIATLGTLGNHDHYDGEGTARRILPSGNLRLLDNQRVFLSRDRQLVSEPQGLCLAGVADLLEDSPSLRSALQGVPPNLPTLLLSHNPDLAEEPQALSFPGRVDLQLSGHTHGGQVRLPVLGTPVTSSRYGAKYAAGLVQGPRWPVYVSRGIGTSGLPVRVGVPPEITLFTLAVRR